LKIRNKVSEKPTKIRAWQTGGIVSKELKILIEHEEHLLSGNMSYIDS
jgi:hypothetical protein